MTTILTFILLLAVSSNPPGTIKIKNLYVDKTEIQNFHWMEYVYLKGKEDSTDVEKLLPASSNTRYSTADYRYKPVVMITYEQALGYCAWRSKAVSGRIGKKVTYRLPTTAEWKDIAEEIIKTDLKQIEIELEETKRKIEKDSGQYVLTGVDKPKSRIYNMFDNVTEMTLDKGIAMGSNNHDLTTPNANLTMLIQYNSPNMYLGFRCVAEMK